MGTAEWYSPSHLVKSRDEVVCGALTFLSIFLRISPQLVRRKPPCLNQLHKPLVRSLTLFAGAAVGLQGYKDWRIDEPVYR